MKNFIIDIFKGMVIGIANVIPGVSGGTMAVSMGIYEKLVKIAGNVFHSIFKDFKNTMKFVLPILIGALIGVLVFSGVIEFTLERFNMQTICLFVGLIIGTFPLVFENANKNGFNKKYLIPAIITGLLMISLMFLTTRGDMVFTGGMNSAIILFVLGIIAAATMVIPGISGSFVLMLLGAYKPILGLVNSIVDLLKLVLTGGGTEGQISILVSNILLLVPFGIGVLVGIIFISKIIDKFLEKAYGYTYYTIIGFIIGSLPLIFKEIEFSTGAVIPSAILLIIGTFASYYISKITKDA